LNIILSIECADFFSTGRFDLTTSYQHRDFLRDVRECNLAADSETIF
jgi:hypothetical protein